MHEAAAIIEPATTRIRDPLSGRSIWMAGMISGAKLVDNTLSLNVKLAKGHTEQDGIRIRDSIVQNVNKLGFDGEVTITLLRDSEPPPPPQQKDPVIGMTGSGTQPHGGPFVKSPLPGVRHIVAVASGKGGVGKSTVSTNLAIALQQEGLAVGIMDADIYGPSIPTMLNAQGQPIANEAKQIIPLEAYGLQVMSMGFLVPEQEAIIWRGPMVMGAVRQLLHDVAWHDLDVLVIDLPPGTGDAQLTMIQTVQLSGAIVVTTPQKVAVVDAERAITMFKKLDIPIFGVVENMAWMTLPDGSKTHPFGSGGGTTTATNFEVPFLGHIPFETQICEGGDKGIPAATRGDGSGQPFKAIATTIKNNLLMD